MIYIIILKAASTTQAQWGVCTEYVCCKTAASCNLCDLTGAGSEKQGIPGYCFQACRGLPSRCLLQDKKAFKSARKTGYTSALPLPA